MHRLNQTRLVGSSIGLALVGLVASLPVMAQTCDPCIFLSCHTPLIGAPSQLWGELEPADTGALPVDRDSTDQGNHGNFENRLRWMSLDVVEDASGAWLFVVADFHIQIWSLATPGQPLLVGDLPLSRSSLQNKPATDGHTPHAFRSIRTAPGDSDLAVVAVEFDSGLSIWDTTLKGAPALIYQHVGLSPFRIHTARLAGRDWAFVTGDLDGEGVRLYDLTTARGLGSVCFDPTTGPSPCPNVHRGPIGSYSKATGIAGVGNYVVVGSRRFLGPGGFEVFDVTDPLNPVRKVGGLGDVSTWSVAMWRQGTGQGAKHYVAARTTDMAYIYDVSCITGACGQPTLVWSQPLTDWTTEPTVTYSEGGGLPMLYWASGKSCGNGATGELLVDVSDPASPRRLATPEYWSHYYWDSPTGGNLFAPREGMFRGSYFYRAGYSALDVHILNGGAPAQPPTVGSVSVSPNPASQCQPVSFTAEDVQNGSGATYAWEVRDAGDGVVASGSAVGLNPFVWDSTGHPVGDYTGRVVATNSAGSSPVVVSPTLSLQGLTPLPAAGSFAPVVVQNNSGAVTFDVNVAGATEWSWDFGEGAGFGSFSSDPVNGPAPTHVYGSLGTFDVKVQVKNCAEGPVESATVQVVIDQLDPLVADFRATTCGGFPLSGGAQSCSTGFAVGFTDNSSGAQTWEYDWDGNGSFEDGPHNSPLTTHVYNTAGTFSPRLRVGRSGASHTFTHAALEILPASPPTPTSPPPPPPPPPGPTPTPSDGCGAFAIGGDCGGPAPPPPGPTATPTPPGPTPTPGSCGGLAIGGTCSDGDGEEPTPEPTAEPTVETEGVVIEGGASDGPYEITARYQTARGRAARTSHDSVLADGIDLSSLGITKGALFTFQDRTNPELLVKVIDGCALNQHRWVFLAATTDIGFEVSVRDLVDGREITPSYLNEDGHPAGPVQDLLAFPCDGSVKENVASALEMSFDFTNDFLTGEEAPSVCQPDGTTLCIDDEEGDRRFQTTVSFQTEQGGGQEGEGHALNLAPPPINVSRGGIFTFMDPRNPEMLVKVLKGCPVNGHWWVFYAATTNFALETRVVDTFTGRFVEYSNPDRSPAPPVLDTRAFACADE